MTQLLSPSQGLEALRHLEPDGQAHLWRWLLNAYHRDAQLRAWLDGAFQRYLEEEQAFAAWVEQQYGRLEAEAEYLAGPAFVKC